MKTHVIVTLLLLASLQACSNREMLREDFHSLPREQWDRDSVVVFDVEVSRPGEYALALYLRHTAAVEQANVACSLVISRQGRMVASRRMEFLLADEDGQWRGSGVALRTLREDVLPPVILDSTGMYRVEVRHRMKTPRLKGIKDVGIQVQHGKK
jgi:gliding motility-associated lipoprotein GldH